MPEYPTSRNIKPDARSLIILRLSDYRRKVNRIRDYILGPLRSTILPQNGPELYTPTRDGRECNY